MKRMMQSSGLRIPNDPDRYGGSVKNGPATPALFLHISNGNYQSPNQWAGADK
jgi:hypothetical protein